MQSTPKPPKSKGPLDDYAKWSGLAFQMIFIIGAGVAAGYGIDYWIGLEFPVFLLIFTILGVFGSIWYVVKDLLKK
ncbi:MAG: AtpZ/AtpI family protein [Bacteroidota bacterium]